MKFMKNKKGDISLNIIVAAAIALTVLVVIILIFTGRLSIFNSALNDCVENSGYCVNEGFGTPKDACRTLGPDFIYKSDLNCGDGRLCCIELLK